MRIVWDVLRNWPGHTDQFNTQPGRPNVQDSPGFLVRLEAVQELPEFLNNEARVELSTDDETGQISWNNGGCNVYVVGGLEYVLFFHRLGMIIPTD